VSTSTHPRPHGRLDSDAVVRLLGPLLDDPERGPDHEPVRNCVIGIDEGPDGLDVHLAPLPHDERCAAAGLFGMSAGPSWCAVALVSNGRGRHPETREVVGEVRSLIVVGRDATVSSALRVGGEPVVDPGAVEGLVVDALHRMLGLESPGEPPPPPLFALAVWAQMLILRAAEQGPLSWDDAVALLPEPPPPDSTTSVEAVVHAVLRSGEDLCWRRLHRRALAGHGTADLSPGDVEWMDATMYARWALGSLPDAAAASDVLRTHGSTRAAAAVTAVADRVRAALAPDR
jgi:hypothetical protein